MSTPITLFRPLTIAEARLVAERLIAKGYADVAEVLIDAATSASHGSVTHLAAIQQVRAADGEAWYPLPPFIEVSLDNDDMERVIEGWLPLRSRLPLRDDQRPVGPYVYWPTGVSLTCFLPTTDGSGRRA